MTGLDLLGEELEKEESGLLKQLFLGYNPAGILRFLQLLQLQFVCSGGVVVLEMGDDASDSHVVAYRECVKVDEFPLDL